MFQAGITAKAEQAEPGRISSPGGAGMPGSGSQQAGPGGPGRTLARCQQGRPRQLPLRQAGLVLSPWDTGQGSHPARPFPTSLALVAPSPWAHLGFRDSRQGLQWIQGKTLTSHCTKSPTG